MGYRNFLFVFGWCVLVSGCHRADPVLPPKFSSIQQNIFDEHCNASSCHGSGVKGGLDLREGTAYTQLIGVPATVDKKNIPAFPRVLRGKPDSSFLYLKLTSPDTSQGELMPRAGERLSQHQLEAIRQWILDGAPEN